MRTWPTSCTLLCPNAAMLPPPTAALLCAMSVLDTDKKLPSARWIVPPMCKSCSARLRGFGARTFTSQRLSPQSVTVIQTYRPTACARNLKQSASLCTDVACKTRKPDRTRQASTTASKTTHQRLCLFPSVRFHLQHSSAP
eukprot:2704426-Rhodomonas_salina.1